MAEALHRIISMRRFISLLVLLVLAAVPAAAVSPQEIVAMKQAGVSDSVLLAIIDRDRTIFTLDAKDIVELKRAGLGERVVVAMLRSGRDERPVPPVSAAPAAQASPAPSADTGAFAIVGHAPDSPAGAQPYFVPAYYGDEAYYVVPPCCAVAPLFVPLGRGERLHGRRAHAPEILPNPSGPFLSDPMQRFQNPMVTIPPLFVPGSLVPPEQQHGGDARRRPRR